MLNSMMRKVIRRMKLTVNTLHYGIALYAILALSGCTMPTDNSVTKAATTRPSGIDNAGMDTTIRAQDDFFGHMNGSWIENTEIPADKSSWGAFHKLRDQSQKDIKAIVEEVSTAASSEDAIRIANLYKSFMNQERIEALGLTPLRKELASIAALDSTDKVMSHFSTAYAQGYDSPLGFWVYADQKDPNTNIVYFSQGGLGLGNRDYYFDESEKGREILEKYTAYITKLLTLAGDKQAQQSAADILTLETALAKHHWTKEDNRNADKTYNKFNHKELRALMADFSWDSYLSDFNMAGETDFIVYQPSYFKQLTKVAAQYDPVTWQAYFRFHLLDSYANYLSEDFNQAKFDFRNHELQGQEEQAPRWKRAIDTLNGSVGELLGKLYVEKHFPPEAKQRMEALVENLKRAYADSIKQLDWMSDTTKQAALKKLGTFTTKIGYPDKWRSYDSLTFTSDNLVENIKRVNTFDIDYMLAKLGKPVDRSEWGMTPQTVNAYYNPVLNEIVFPAAILQPPFFDMSADDAVNYGGIGAVIGHEIGHGFDDQGSKYDGDGKLQNWWQAEDREQFQKRTQALVAQYSAFEALPGEFVNGEYTLGENIGDLGGLSIAYKAYELSLNGKPSPVIDGYTGEQRVFLGWAQVWRTKYRQEMLSQRLKNDPHSPARFRVNGTVANIPAFYDAFEVKKGDKLYLPPEQRVKIW